MITVRPEYEQIATKCLEKYPELELLKSYPCRIAFLGSDRKKMKKGMKVFADCTKTSSKYGWCCEYDFFITVYEPNCSEFVDSQLETLIRHELMHIDVHLDDSGTPGYSIKDHDIQDFRAILEELGADWAEPGAISGQMTINDYNVAADKETQ